jgi:hypothetical protein
MRAQIADRFAELHAERQQLQDRLGTLTAATPKTADTTLLDQLSLAGDILPGMPDALKARLLAAFDIQILWNKPCRQATVHAEITDATLQALPGILDPDQDGYDDTSETIAGEAESMEDLFEVPIGPQINHEARINPVNSQLYRTGERISFPPSRLRRPARAVSTPSVGPSGRIGA